MIAEEGVPAWEQDLENTQEKADGRRNKEKTMEKMRKLKYI
jgi:hypothetical protein